MYYWKKKTVVSFILSLLVVLIHASAVSQYVVQLEENTGKEVSFFVYRIIQDGIASVAVPLFFIISGATFFRDYDSSKYKQKIKKRIRTLVIPYLIWNTLVMCFYIFCSYTPIQQWMIGRERFVITVPNVLEAVFFYRCNYVFWFLYNLIIFVFAAPLFDLLTKTKPQAICVIVLMILLAHYLQRSFGLMKLDSRAFVYYLFGCTIGKYYFNIFTKMSTRRQREVSIIIFLICVVLQMLEIYDVLSLPLAVRLVYMLVFCLVFWHIMDALATHVDVRKYMKYTFFIYALHPDVQAVFTKIVYYLGPKKIWMAFPNMLVSFFSTVAAIVIIGIMLSRYTPKLYRVLSGER